MKIAFKIQVGLTYRFIHIVDRHGSFSDDAIGLSGLASYCSQYIYTGILHCIRRHSCRRRRVRRCSRRYSCRRRRSGAAVVAAAAARWLPRSENISIGRKNPVAFFFLNRLLVF